MTDRKKRFNDLFINQPKNEPVIQESTVEIIQPLENETRTPVVSDNMIAIQLDVFNHMIQELRESIHKEVAAHLSSINVNLSESTYDVTSILKRLDALEQTPSKQTNTSWAIERDEAGNLVRFVPE